MNEKEQSVKVGSLGACKHTNWEPRAETCSECDWFFQELAGNAGYEIRVPITFELPYYTATIKMPAKKGFEFL